MFTSPWLWAHSYNRSICVFILGCSTVLVTSLLSLKWSQLKQPKNDAGIIIYICSHLEPEANITVDHRFCSLWSVNSISACTCLFQHIISCSCCIWFCFWPSDKVINLFSVTSLHFLLVFSLLFCLLNNQVLILKHWNSLPDSRGYSDPEICE